MKREHEHMRWEWKSDAMMHALKICKHRPKYVTQTVSALAVAAMLKVFRSVAFNLLVLAVGFSLGYMTIAVDVHQVAKHNELYHYGVQIQQKVDELDKLDKQYAKKRSQIREIVKKFNAHIAHEENAKAIELIDCGSEVGKKLWKEEDSQEK